MDITRFYVKEIADTETVYLEDSTSWFIKVRALNNRERRERDQLGVREKVLRPSTERGRRQMKESDVQETALEYLIARIREYEYDHCIDDFVLPYLPANSTSPVDFRKKDHSRDEVKEFYDMMPAALA